MSNEKLSNEQPDLGAQPSSPETNELKANPMAQINQTPHSLMYADQPCGMVIGPFTSKVTFGIVEHDQRITPTVTIVMPTVSLAALAQEIEKNLKRPEVRTRIQKTYDEFMERK